MSLNFKIPLVSKNRVGFRLSQIDVVMLVATGLLTYYMPYGPDNITTFFHYLIPYIVGNFFLFCNVFRVRTKYELCWLFTASINTGLYLCYYEDIPVFFITQSLFTVIAIAMEIKSKSYHGVFAKHRF